ncbi:hypothetical protein BH11ACT8_BH11ACT8_28950 [soil metagenome]
MGRGGRRCGHLALGLVLASALAAPGAAGAVGPAPAPISTATTAGPAAGGPTSEAGRYHAIAPRLFRNPHDQLRPGRLRAGGRVALKMLGGNGIPATGVEAVMLLVTARGAPSAGRVDIGTAVGAATARLLVPRGAVVSNQVLVVPDADGNVALRTSVRALVQVRTLGWVGETGAASAPGGPAADDGLVRAITPVRVFDTQKGVNTRRSPLTGRRVRTLDLSAFPAIPAGAGAVIANVTVRRPTSGGYLELYARSVPRPQRPEIAITRGVDSTQQVLLPVDRSRRISLFALPHRVDVSVDVQGYLLPTADPATPGLHVGPAPARLLDTRRSPRRAPPRSETALPIAGRYGVPATADTVTVNVTAIGGRRGETVRLSAAGGLRPDAPPFVLTRRRQATSLTLNLPLGPDGAVALKRGTAAVVLDVVGWGVPAPLVLRGPDPSTLEADAPLPADTALAADVLAQSTRYVLGSWWRDVRPELVHQPLDTVTEKQLRRWDRPPARNVRKDPRANAVRRLSMAAFGLATSLATTTDWDAEQLGVSRSTAVQRVGALVGLVSARHVSQRRGGWGAGSQGSMWAGYLGRAAWLVWPDLPAAVRQRVAELVAYEADEVAGRRITYLRDGDGAFLRDPGNSGAEEVSWEALSAQLALAMLPDDERRAGWSTSVVQHAIAAWARPEDLGSDTVVNGRPVSQWLDGSNVEADGTVRNHHRVAPDYMANTFQTLDQVWVQAAVHAPTPSAARTLVRPIYDAFTGVSYATPPFAAPGGPIYADDSADVYYPEGNDWGTGQQLVYALIDAQSTAYGIDPGDGPQRFADLHLRAARTMQQRFTDGRTYGATTELNYVGREELSAQLAAQILLTLRTRDNGGVSFSDADAGSF